MLVQDGYLDKIATKFNLNALFLAATGTLLGKVLAA